MKDYEVIPFNCPKCGGVLNCFRIEKITTCDYCDSRIALSIDLQNKLKLKIIEDVGKIELEEAVIKCLLNEIGEFQVLIMRKIWEYQCQKNNSQINIIDKKQVILINDLRKICKRLSEIESRVYIAKSNINQILKSRSNKNFQNERTIKSETTLLIMNYKMNSGRCLLEIENMRKIGVDREVTNELFCISIGINSKHFDSWMENSLIR